MSESTTKSAPKTVTKPPKPKPEPKKKSEKMPPWNVVLLDDDEHSYEYVIEMLKELFGHPVEKGYQLAKVVDTKGRAIVCTTSLERAELKRDQIHAYGPDPYSSKDCKGSMTAVIEPAV